MACAADLISTSLGRAEINCAYITLSRKNAKRIIWRDLQKILKKNSIPHKADNQELTILFENGSMIYLFGANDEGEIENIRGTPFALVYIDEAQAFKPYLKGLIFDVLSPSLYDYDGKLVLLGTPGATKHGIFFEACHGLVGFKGFSRHSWTMFQNPFLEAKSGKKVRQLVDEDLAFKGITEDHPSIQREIFARWVEDRESLVYKFSEEKNFYEELPTGISWYYVISADIGFDDPDAVVVWAYHPEVREIYLVEEYRKPKQTISDLAEAVKALLKKYPFAKLIIDAGALGKKITEELKQRFGLDFTPADKQQKLSFIELMNDDFRAGNIKVKPGFKIVDEWKMLCWDLEHTPPIEDPRFGNDLPDAGLYGWRECRRLVKREPAEKPNLDVTRQMDEYWKRKSHEQTKGQEWWERS